MDELNLGPAWLWKLLGFLSVIGFITLIILIIKGIVWLITHVHFS